MTTHDKLKTQSSGCVVVLAYSFETGKTHVYRKPFYWSKKNRICFQYGPGLFNGMVTPRLHQFEFAGKYAFMYTWETSLPETRAHFNACVLKAIRRIKTKENKPTMIPYAQAPKQELPPIMKTQMQPYIDYFEAKFKEVELSLASTFEKDDKDNLVLNGLDNWLVSDKYARGVFNDGKRIVFLGTALGVIAMYEVKFDVKVPVSVSESGTLTVTNYKLHAPEILWKSGIMKTTMQGGVDISTYIDIFGYPKRTGRDDHNKHNIAKRLDLIADVLKAR